MVNLFLGAFLFITILEGQETDTSITIAHFMYPKIEGIPIILDESGENSFFLNVHFPHMLNDYSINNVMVDGGLHLPQGSYFLPALLPKGTAPDSIHNYSQINYRKGDYNSGELGLALQIEGMDSSYFTLQGFRQSPPVIYSSSSWDDNLQNYLMSYRHLSKDAAIMVAIMYHLEDYHLPLQKLQSSDESEYEREAESFHGGLGFEKKWENLWLDVYPAFQLTHANRHYIHQPDSTATYLTLWNNFVSKLALGDHFNVSLQQKSKMMMVEKDNLLTEIETHILRPKLHYNSGGILLEGGVALYRGLIEPEGKVSWQYKHLYVAAGRELHIFFEPVQMAEYIKKEYSLISIKIGYISNLLKVVLDIFQVAHSGGDYPGISGEMEMDHSWIRLSHKAGMYNINSDDGGPVDMFNHLSLLFSPNIWPWRTTRFQLFMGFESFYLQHSGKAAIDPTTLPILADANIGYYTSNLINMEFGILVNRFKVSYRFKQSNIIGDNVPNSSRTYPILPVQQLEVVWQFWN